MISTSRIRQHYLISKLLSKPSNSLILANVPLYIQLCINRTPEKLTPFMDERDIIF